MIKILLVDDHQIMREGLRSMLESADDLEVVGESDSGRRALEQIDSLSPDVVVMDVGMKDLPGAEATRRIKSSRPDIAVVALSAHDRHDYVKAMLESGASAYVVKANAYADLVEAIRAVSSGKRYLSPEVAGGVIDAGFATDGAQQPPPTTIGPREREVLRLIAEGLRSAEIGERLGISTHTVETHRRNIMRKLDLHSVADITRYAIRTGIASAES